MPDNDAVLPQYTPMIPTLVRSPFHRDGWVYEEKVDGWRILAYKDGGRVRLVSREGVTHDGRPRRQRSFRCPANPTPRSGKGRR
jgi:hypothetical protein